MKYSVKSGDNCRLVSKSPDGSPKSKEQRFFMFTWCGSSDAQVQRVDFRPSALIMQQRLLGGPGGAAIRLVLSVSPLVFWVLGKSALRDWNRPGMPAASY
jgi:hypothetical protein